MIARAAAVLLATIALASCREPITVDTKPAQAIPAEMAVAGLRELLPKTVYLSCGQPRVEISASQVGSWSVDDKGVEVRTTAKASYRLAYSSVKGTDLTRLPLSYELRIFVATDKAEPKDLFRFNWRQEEPARRALEYFEALREDR